MNTQWKKLGRILGRHDPRIVYEALRPILCGRCGEQIEVGAPLTLERRVSPCCGQCGSMQLAPTAAVALRQHRGGRPRVEHSGHMISPDAARLLGWLQRDGSPHSTLSNEELSAQIRRRPSTVQRVLQELERASLIRRRWDGSRRVRTIELLSSS